MYKQNRVLYLRQSYNLINQGLTLFSTNGCRVHTNDLLSFFVEFKSAAVLFYSCSKWLRKSIVLELCAQRTFAYKTTFKTSYGRTSPLTMDLKIVEFQIKKLYGTWSMSAMLCHFSTMYSRKYTFDWLSAFVLYY